MTSPFIQPWRKPGSIRSAPRWPGSCALPPGACSKVPRGSELKLVVRWAGPHGDEETLTVMVKRSRMPGESTVLSREVAGLPVLRISHWGNDSTMKLVARFDELLAQFRDRPGLVIDVRGNGGGLDDLASQVVGRFLKTTVVASISFHRQVPGLTFERTVDRIAPRGPWRYEGRVAVLTDEGCMSASEHFVSGMAEAGAPLCWPPPKRCLRLDSLPRSAWRSAAERVANLPLAHRRHSLATTRHRATSLGAAETLRPAGRARYGVARRTRLAEKRRPVASPRPTLNTLFALACAQRPRQSALRLDPGGD